jgi:hypothetical protein
MANFEVGKQEADRPGWASLVCPLQHLAVTALHLALRQGVARLE